MSRSRGLAMLVAIGAIMLAGCGGTGDDPETEREQYLREVTTEDSEAFFNAEAALGYLRMYCQVAEMDLARVNDHLDWIVASHCGGDLATSVGVTREPPQPTTEGRDMDKVFTRIALVDFGIVDPRASASYLCDGNNPASILPRLGADFEGSFQEFAMITRCPEVLREYLRHAPAPGGA